MARTPPLEPTPAAQKAAERMSQAVESAARHFGIIDGDRHEMRRSLAKCIDDCLVEERAAVEIIIRKLDAACKCAECDAAIANYRRLTTGGAA